MGQSDFYTKGYLRSVVVKFVEGQDKEPFDPNVGKQSNVKAFVEHQFKSDAPMTLLDFTVAHQNINVRIDHVINFRAFL